MRGHGAWRAVRRGAAGAIAGMGAAALLAACSGGGSSSAASTSGGAASTTAGASAAASGSSGASAGPGRAGGLKELSARTRAATLAKSTVHMTMAAGPTSSQQQKVATAQLRLRDKGTDMALELTSPAGTKVVSVGGTVYIATGQAIGGKHWIKIDPAGKDPVSRSVAPLLSSMTGNLDVTSQLTRMPDAKLSSATAATDGATAVTRYVVTTTERDLVAAAEAFGLPAAIKQQTLAALKGAHGTSTIDVDASDLPVRAESVVRGSARSDTDTTVTYSGWGEPVTIAAPRASDVVDPAALGG